MTLGQFVLEHKEAAKLFPDGVPDWISPPDWDSNGNGEMDLCQRELFLEYAPQAAALPLDRVMWAFDCIGFTDGHEAGPWVRVWMCAAYCAVDVVGDRSANVTQWAEFAVTKALDAKAIQIPLESLHHFGEHICDGREYSQEYFAAVDRYVERLGAG
ncbi:MAG: hypothetical protein ACO1SV_03040 [Fimbriimonas sp.]